MNINWMNVQKQISAAKGHSLFFLLLLSIYCGFLSGFSSLALPRVGIFSFVLFFCRLSFRDEQNDFQALWNFVPLPVLYASALSFSIHQANILLRRVISIMFTFLQRERSCSIIISRIFYCPQILGDLCMFMQKPTFIFCQQKMEIDS